MSSGLYTKAHVARYLGKRPQDIQGLIERDGLPAVPVPSETRQDDRIPLHSLWRWCKERSKGGKFMTVDELAHEMELCAAPGADSTSKERELLNEITALSEVITRNLQQGSDPQRTRRALKEVIQDWNDLHSGSAALGAAQAA